MRSHLCSFWITKEPLLLKLWKLPKTLDLFCFHDYIPVVATLSNLFVNVYIKKIQGKKGREENDQETGERDRQREGKSKNITEITYLYSISSIPIAPSLFSP